MYINTFLPEITLQQWVERLQKNPLQRHWKTNIYSKSMSCIVYYICGVSKIHFTPYKLLELVMQDIKKQSGLFTPPDTHSTECELCVIVRLVYIEHTHTHTHTHRHTSARLCALHTKVSWVTITWWVEHKTQILMSKVCFAEKLEFYKIFSQKYNDFNNAVELLWWKWLEYRVYVRAHCFCNYYIFNMYLCNYLTLTSFYIYLC